MSTLSTSNGAPVSDGTNSYTAGPNGPIALADFHLIDKLAHFDRERIPERVVHAKGSGAHGYLEVTNPDLPQWTKAAFLGEVGKRTPLFIRFSTVGGEKGSADTARDPRGTAIKFYTEEGNYDIVGNNTPVFFIRDPVQFPSFIHTQKRHPQTNINDANYVFDFFSQVPETCHQMTILFSDRGTPYGYRHMNMYGSHTFAWVNEAGERVWVKYHFKTDQGVRNLDNETAERIAGSDPDWAQRDLFNSIANGDAPSWSMYVQIITEEQRQNLSVNLFDVTKVVPHSEAPLIPVGRVVLNRNPENYFAEVEQSAFSPSHLVPGVEMSPDKMLQGRLFSYPDTHRHRLGVNYHQIPINMPYRAANAVNHLRDGAMCVNGNGGAAPNYWPNTFAGEQTGAGVITAWNVPETTVAQFDRNEQHANDDYQQAGDLYRLMDEGQQARLVANLAGALSGANADIRDRMYAILKRCDQAYGDRVEAAVNEKLADNSEPADVGLPNEGHRHPGPGL